METITVLWAVKIGEPDWCEVIITNKAERIDKAKEWAANNGYNRFRLATMEVPKLISRL